MTEQVLEQENTAAPPDAPLFFSTPELTQRIDLLRHLVENSELVPLVRGSAGAGKTAMLRRLYSIASDNWSVCCIDGNPMLHPEQLLFRMAQFFNMPDPEEVTIEGLGIFLAGMNQEGIRPVVLVDDTDQLPATTLITLLRLHERDEPGVPLLSLVLFANPLIDRLLATPQLHVMNLQIIHVINVPPLTLEQVPDYVRQHLAGDGFTGEISLDPVQVEKAYSESGGLPGRINDLIVRTVRNSIANRPPSVQAKNRSGSQAPLWISLGIVVVVLSLLGLAFQADINRLFLPSVPQTSVETAADQPIPSTPPGAERTAQDSVSTADGLSTEKTERPLELPSKQDKPTESIKAPLEHALADQTGSLASDEQVSEEEEQLRLSVATLNTVLESAETKAGPVARVTETEITARAPFEPPVPQQAAQPDPLGSTSDQARARVEEPVTSDVLDKSPAQETAAVDKQSASPTSAAERPKAFAAPAEPKSEEPATPVFKKHDWLLKQRPTDYTLQLLGVQEEKSIASFVQRNRLDERAVYFESVRDGRPWYSLVYGVYPSRDAAIAAKKSLPSRLRKKDVWARSLDSVQKEIRARN